MKKKKYFVIDYVKEICEHELSKLQPIEFRKDKNYN
jgi:hypothetical protein